MSREKKMTCELTAKSLRINKLPRIQRGWPHGVVDITPDKLTIIPWARVGYELAITDLISNKREWNNCLIKNAPKI